jgi:hypothetical protein
MIGYKFNATELCYENKINKMTSHHKQYGMGLLLWPKCYLKMRQKRIMYHARGLEYLYNSLYVKLSEFIGDNKQLIGHGMFSNIPIAEDTVIENFKGTFINNDERQRRQNSGRGGYF